MIDIINMQYQCQTPYFNKLIKISSFMHSVVGIRLSKSVVWYQFHTTPQKCCLNNTTPQHSTLRWIWKFKMTQKLKFEKPSILTKFWKIIIFAKNLKKSSILAQIWKIFIFAKTLKIINFGQILKNHHEKIINSC